MGWRPYPDKEGEFASRVELQLINIIIIIIIILINDLKMCFKYMYSKNTLYTLFCIHIKITNRFNIYTFIHR